MTPYKNLSGDSGVVAYEIRSSAIHVQFKRGPIYVYNDVVPGHDHVEEMKRLALKGEGLSTYISKHVRKQFAAKR